jgi:hypothetical protein
VLVLPLDRLLHLAEPSAVTTDQTTVPRSARASAVARPMPAVGPVMMYAFLWEVMLMLGLLGM